jgi:hypothetical protein
MNRDDRKVFLHAGLIAAAVVIAATLAHAADPPRLPPGVTCADVRAKVAEHGKVYAYAWARLNGYTTAQINEAKKCVR